MASHTVNDSDDDGEGQGTIFLKPTGPDVEILSANNGVGTSEPMLNDDEEVAVPMVLETVSERRARRTSHYIVYFSSFIGSIGFSIVLTGVWPYLQQLDPGVSKEFLGWVIAANPFGQMITSPILGLWANKAGSNRGPLLFAVMLFIIGNILYAILSLFGYASRAVMVFARFLVGISFANMAIIRSYVASSTTINERTKAVAFTSAAQGCGFIIGPGLQAAIAFAFSQEKESKNSSSFTETDDRGSQIEWNMYTATGWSAAVLGLVNFILFMPCLFKEHSIAAKEAQIQKLAANQENTKIPNPDYKAVICILVSFFIVQFVFVLIEVVLVPMCIDMYAWSDETALKAIGIGLCVGGIVVTIMFGLVDILVKNFDERKVYIFLGLIPLLVSMVCFIPMGSTYPKMQNCTLETEEHHNREERNVHRHLQEIHGRDSSAIYDDIPQENYSIPFPNQNAFESLEIDRILHDNQFLLRKRRGISRDKQCHDLGCPVEQEWCFYTPIIEKSQMIVACLVAFIGYPIAFSLSSSLFSKVLGPKPQGVWMGVLTSTGSFSRMTGPIFVSYMYTELGTRWTFGILFVILTITIILTLIFYKRLIPMKIT